MTCFLVNMVVSSPPLWTQVYFKQLCRKCQNGFNPYRVESIQCKVRGVGGEHSRCSAWCLCPFSLWGHALKQGGDFLDYVALLSLSYVMDTQPTGELTCLPLFTSRGQCCCNYSPVSQVCSQTRCCCEQKERHIDMKRPHRQDLCGRCRGKRISCDTTYSYKYIVWT